LWFSDDAHFHLTGLVNKQNTKFWVSENSQSNGDITLSCKMHHVVCNQQTGAYQIDLYGGNYNKPAVTAATAKRVILAIQGAEHADKTILQQDGA